MNTDRRARALVAAAVLLGCGMPLLIASLTGAIDLPRNDDWAYMRAAHDLAYVHLNFYGWPVMNLGGQLVAAAPFVWIFGSDPVVLDLVGVLFAGAAILGVSVLISRLAGARAGAFCALALAGFPLFGLLSVSFMTDLPVLAVSLWALVALEATLRHRSWRLWSLGLLLAEWAFAIREVGVVTLIVEAAAGLSPSGTPVTPP